jgi:putative transport protein
MQTFIAFLNDVPLAGLMLVVALGYTLGRQSIRGISLGPAGGTLAVALLVGAMGLSFKDMYGSEDPRLTLGTLGFALFIYSVGLEAGPRFFSSLLGGAGWKIAGVCLTVNLLAVAIAIVCGLLFGLDDSVTAGVLSGALTSAPTYAAAAEVCSNQNTLTLSFALTYPFGLIGVVLMVMFLPRAMRDDLSTGTSEIGDVADTEVSDDPEVTRAFSVDNDGTAGKSLHELELTRRTGCYVITILRDGEIVIPTADTCLKAGDHLQAKGRIDELLEFQPLVGPEIHDREFRRRLPPPRRVRVFNRVGIGKSLAELDLTGRHRVLVTSIDRAGIIHEPSADFVIQRADILRVAGPRRELRQVAHELGRFERPTGETDIAVYAGGIVLGMLIANIDFGVFDLRLGYASGLLLAGVLLGRFRRIGRISTHVPRPARQLVRDLGILLFIAETGVRATDSTLADINGVILLTLLAGMLTTTVPVVAGIHLARRRLKMKPADSWGAVGGAMTSSAALVAIRRAADSNEPALSYTAAYAVASVLVTLAGRLVVRVMS